MFGIFIWKLTYIFIKIVAHWFSNDQLSISALIWTLFIVKSVDVCLSPAHMLATDNSMTHFKLCLQRVPWGLKLLPTAILVWQALFYIESGKKEELKKNVDFKIKQCALTLIPHPSTWVSWLRLLLPSCQILYNPVRIKVSPILRHSATLLGCDSIRHLFSWGPFTMRLVGIDPYKKDYQLFEYKAVCTR